VTDARGWNPAVPWRVKTWTTPPTPSLPYSADAGPLSTSIRSIMSTGILSQVGLPVVAEPTRTPSTSRMVWRFSAPRMNTLDSLPSPPLALICRPALRASNSGSVRAVDASMVSREITVTSLTSSSARVSVRVAVTTTDCRPDCGQAAPWQATSASGTRARRARETGIFMMQTR
jgi:hypothetical protein